MDCSVVLGELIDFFRFFFLKFRFFLELFVGYEYMVVFFCFREFVWDYLICFCLECFFCVIAVREEWLEKGIKFFRGWREDRGRLVF